MENSLINKNGFLIKTGLLAIISYILGLWTKIGSEISYLTVIYAFLIFLCCFYYKFKEPSSKPINSWIITSIFAFLLGSATIDIYQHELLLVPIICLLILGLAFKLKNKLSEKIKWFHPENEIAYNYYQIIFPLLTVFGILLLGLTAIFMIQTNSVYTWFSQVLFALNLIVMSITFIMSSLTILMNNTKKSVYASSYVTMFTLYGILVSHHYLIK